MFTFYVNGQDFTHAVKYDAASGTYVIPNIPGMRESKQVNNFPTHQIFDKLFNDVTEMLKNFFKLPKSWKWFDIFRTYQDMLLIPIPKIIGSTTHRVQERLSLLQKSKQKRKQFIQSLYK